MSPLKRLAGSSSVRTSSSTTSDSSALLVQILRPVTMSPPWPSSDPRVLMRLVSVPASGSVTPKATCRSPAAARGRKVRFSRSLPNFTTGFSPNMVRCSADEPFMAAPDAATRLSTRAASVMPRPPPPYSSGMAMPTQPALAMTS